MADPYEFRDEDRDYFEGRQYYDPFRYNPVSRGYDRGYGFRSSPYYDDDYVNDNMYSSSHADRNRYGSGRRYDYYESPYYYGQYTGYGPRGYTRSDDAIRDDINERLTWDGRIDATDVNVEVTGGVVELSGSVDDRQQKRTAERIADSVSGVWDVHNHLTIRRQRGPKSSQALQSASKKKSTGNTQRGDIKPGMDVIDSQGGSIGTVKELRDNDFLLDRPLARDVYIPFSACNVSGGQVRLNLRAIDIDKQDWPLPEIFGSRR